MCRGLTLTPQTCVVMSDVAPVQVHKRGLFVFCCLLHCCLTGCLSVLTVVSVCDRVEI